MALDTSKFKQNPLAASNASMVKLQAESVKQQMVSNHLLSDLVSIQSQQLKLQKQQMLLDKKKIQASKFSRQEASIERMSSGISKSVKGGPAKKKGKVNPKDLLKILGLGALAGGTAMIASNSDAILGLIANTLDNVAGSIDNAEKKLREFGERAKKTYGQLRNLATPIDGFSAFGIGNMAMGVTTAKKMTALKDGAKVRGAIRQGVSNVVGKDGLIRNSKDGLITKAKSGIQGGVTSATPGVTRALDSVDDLAKTPTAATKITPARIFGRVREAFQPMGVGDPSKSVAARFQRLVGGGQGALGAAQGRVANTAKAIKQQSQLFMQGITGANNATVLRTAGRPFPNVARGAGALGDEAGRFFRAGRGIRTGVQNVASGKALQDLFSQLGKLKAKSITGLSNVFKALPGQIGAMGKAAAQLGKNFKTAIANFDLGKAGIQLGKVATRGGVATARSLPAVAKGTVGALKGAGGLLKGGGKGLLGAAKIGGAGLKRIPIIGSLLSAGFGAMEANEEEMARLMKENNMSREEVQAGLADGSLQKDKGKIVARSAGAGIGAGAGAVVGGILGSALGPIGTALGAAAGSWLGENIGKFFAEPFAKIFKGFNFGETFGPLLDTFKVMTSGISDAFGQIFAAFGGGGDGEGEGEGFIGAIKKAGEIVAVLAKLSLKLLVPTLQLVMKGIELLVGGIKNVIVGIVNGIKGMIDGVMNLPFIGDQIRGALERGGGFLKAINEFADQDLSIKNEAFGTGGGQLPATGVGGGGGRPILTSGRGWRWGKMHQGIDIGFAGDRGGQPMYLPRSAVVTDARAAGRGDAGYGNSIYFTTDDGVTHLYAHMQRPTNLRIGQSYKKGTFVGKLGNTGRSTAPHLHWETSRNEADVGRGGPGLKDPRKFGYSLNSPFSSTGAAGVSSSMNYGERSALTTTVATSGNPLSNTLRNMSGSVRGLQEQLNRRTGLQADTGDKMDLQAELLKALGVMGGGTAAATTASASNAGDGGTPVASGTVAMFPTASPVRDGGHVFEVVN